MRVDETDFERVRGILHRWALISGYASGEWLLDLSDPTDGALRLFCDVDAEPTPAEWVTADTFESALRVAANYWGERGGLHGHWAVSDGEFVMTATKYGDPIPANRMLAA